jgi:glucose-1-phosphate cytidylyltransferase
MKVIILAGGFGTRLSEYTENIPKPMVTIGGYPILWHIMKNYAYFGHKDFYLALGYKAEVVKEYFLNYHSTSNDFTVDLSTGHVDYRKIDNIDWKVNLIDTGLKTMTGGRIKQLQKFIGNETFMLTYGDGVANVDIDALLEFHKNHGKMVTLTSVRPSARFGDLEFDGDRVSSFQEKPQLHEGWINGGFFVCEPEVFNFIDDDTQMFEREPLEKIVKEGQLMAYKHDKFWHCMDTKRDRDLLESLYNQGAPWKVR